MGKAIHRLCIEEEIELRKITRIKANETERLETEIKEMEELKIEGESKATKLLTDSNFEKGLKIDEIITIEIRLENLKIPETTINAIKKSIILTKYLHPILRHKKYCA